MPTDHSRFHQAYRQHLLAAQRQEVLRALRDTLDPETTLGEIVDAAESLGWGEPFGDMSLAELADALVEADDEPKPVAIEPVAAAKPAAPPMPVINREALQAELEQALGIGRGARPRHDDPGDEYEDEQDDDEEHDEEDDDEPAAKPVAKKKTSKRLAKTSSKKAAKQLPVREAAKKAAKKAASTPVKQTSKKAVKKAASTPAKKASKKATAAKPASRAAASKKPAKKKSRR